MKTITLYLMSALLFAGCEPSEQTRALSAAETSVRESLLAPSTAKFSPASDARFSTKEGNHVVAFWVDSQNAFGVPIRRHLEVEVQPSTYTVKGIVCLEDVAEQKRRETEGKIEEMKRQIAEIKRSTDEYVHRLERQ